MTVVSLLLFVISFVAALYIPLVQDYIVPRVLSLINTEEMNISVERFRLSFPLNVSVSGLEIKQKGDTMLMAGNVNVRVSPLPLLSGKIDAGDIDLGDVYYKSGTPDSASYIRARVGRAGLMNATLALGNQSVDFDNVQLSDGDVRIALKNDTTPPAPPSAPAQWKINGKKISLDNINYEMTMVGTGDSIGARLDNFTLAGGMIDLGRHTVTVDDVIITGVAGRYITGPGAVTALAVSEADTVAADPEPWSIRVNHLLLDKGKALYAAAGAKPQPGLDMQYIDVSTLTVEVDSFYNRGAEMRVPLKRLFASERSGLQLAGNGVFAMDSTGISARDFKLKTLASELDFDASYGMASADAPLSVALKGEIDPSDVSRVFPAIDATIGMLPKYRKLDVKVDASGTLADLRISGVEASMRNYFDVRMKGAVKNISDFNNARGHVDIDGDFEDMDFMKPTLMDAKLGKSTHLPPLKLDGSADMAAGVISGKLQALTSGGDIALDGSWNSRVEGYNVDFKADRFPAGAFMPGLGVGKVTAKIDAHGQGLDPMSPRTKMYAAVDAIDVIYRGYSLRDVQVVANLSDGNADLDVTSSNKVVDGNLHASGNLAGKTYDWSMIGDFRNIDLYALGLTDTVSSVAASIAGNVRMTPAANDIDAVVEIHSVDAVLGATRFTAKDFNVDFIGNDSLTQAYIDNQDLKINFTSPMVPDSVTSRFTRAMALITPMVDTRYIDVDQLQRQLPPLELDITAGERNAVHDYLASTGTTFRYATLRATNDSIIRITASVDTLVTGSSRFDRIDFSAGQEGERLNYEVTIDNQPGTMDDFAHIAGKGYIGGDKVMMALQQRNIHDATGYKIGALVELSDSTLKLKFDPIDPVIGYKQWTVNPDNYISLNTRTYHLDADLLMANNDSRLHIYTEHDPDGDSSHQESVNVDIDKIQIADWISFNPYAPPMKGDLSADLRFSMAPGTLNGDGSVTLADFTYARKRVGTLDLDLNVTTSRSGAINAITGLKIDGKEVMRAKGALNDTTLSDPFMLDFALTRFPLDIANPFIGGTAMLGGYLNGEMDVTGSMAAPEFNGYLDFDSATAKVSMIGTTFSFSEDKIPVDSNVIHFDNYPIYGVNDSPLEINGIVDLRSLSDIALDLALKADNMQVVGNEKRRGSDVYGKAFISVDARAKGDMHFINARANLTVKEGTNVTYVMPEAGSQISSQNTGDMVHFVNFADTTAIVKMDSVPPGGLMMNLTALLNVEEGSVIGVDLSANGQDRVQVQSNGVLDFSMNPLGDTRTTGRLNLTGGYVRYSPPLMSEKMFDFQEGSYVAFNGDMANPTLHVTAIDVIKANVTQDGQNSRLVNFDVILKVNGTLDEMDVAFDLDTDEDVTVRNELQSMSPEQRANQAMNLLLYNVYTGPGTKANANISGNPLYSFLSSQLNTWMANNVKGVDISFGIDQYDRTVDGAQSTTTSYSYKVSKSFFDDRFKVVVGGNYSTDADPDENLSQNLVNDISVEYLLNKSGTMYVRLFRHTGYESILEGEVTQTGVGFVYKRKLRTLRNLFRRRNSQVTVLPQEGAVRIAGDILRSMRSRTAQPDSDRNVNTDRQPINVKEDENVSE